MSFYRPSETELHDVLLELVCQRNYTVGVVYDGEMVADVGYNELEDMYPEDIEKAIITIETHRNPAVSTLLERVDDSTFAVNERDRDYTPLEYFHDYM